MRDKYPAIDAWPKIVPADTRTSIRLDVGAWAAQGELLRVVHNPLDTPSADQGIYEARVLAGILEVGLLFEGEQEHYLRVFRGEDVLGKACVYSLAPDLFARTPLKGDFHMHSLGSDGRDEPAEVLAHCRRIGLDIAGLTDHHLYAPSLEAIGAFDGVPLDMIMCPGEEVHAPGNPLHVVNFGGAFSVNERFRADEAAYREEVEAIAQNLPADIGEPTRFEYAASLWVFEQIQKAGGMSVYCHPYWIYYNQPGRQANHISGALRDLLFASRAYDAYEMIGGYHMAEEECECNHLQILRYYKEAAMGNTLPIVGVSDAHGCTTGALFGWYYTIAFAPAPTAQGVVSSIRDLMSVAVAHLPGGEPRAYGPLRLVRYAQFLLRCVFPAHDMLCQEEGLWMLAHLLGRQGAKEKLAVAHGRVPAYYARCFGRE